MTHFQEMLLSERNGKGYTQEEFATILGFDIDKYKLWEKGEIYPNVEELELVSNQLNTPPRDWIGQDKTFIEKRIKDYAEILKRFTYGSLVLAIITTVFIVIFLVPTIEGHISGMTFGWILVAILGVEGIIYYISLLRMNRIRQEMQVDEYSKLLKYIED